MITASAGWINDIYAGYGPTDPKFGVYGNPNDGTYVPGQRFTIGGVTATVLSTDGDVDVIGTRGKSVTVDAMSYRDLTGTTFTAFVSTGIAASAAPVVRPTVTVVSASPGKIRVSLSAAQTAVLTPAKTYYLFLRESHSDGTVRTRVAAVTLLSRDSEQAWSKTAQGCRASGAGGRYPRALCRLRTSSLVSLLATSIAKHSRVNSSMTASCQHPDGPAIGCAVGHEVVAPRMISMGWPQPDARAVVQPQPPSLRLLCGHLQPLLTPDPFHPLMVHAPSLESAIEP